MRNKHTETFGALATGVAVTALGTWLLGRLIRMPDGFGWMLVPLVWLILGIIVIKLL